jgi:hypothetical protein
VSVADSAASVRRASSFSSIAGTSVAWFAITPRSTQGSQIAAMHSGYRITVLRNWDMRRAVRQKMVMCGKAIEESGMKV